MLKQTGAQIIVRLLERQGIRLIAGIPGGMNLPLYDALAQSRTIRHILTRHEQGAGFLAQGIARATGETAVCFATSGPGATNLITALADAKLDSIPVVAITGQVPGSLIGTDAFQEVDVYGLSIPITKHNFLVRETRELLQVIPEAFRIAASGRPGPVLIDVPKDVQTQAVEFPDWPLPGEPDPHPEINDQAINQAVELINQSERPLLYLGGGVVHAEATDLARGLAEHAGIPGVMSLMGLGVLPSGHALSLGMLGMHGTHCANLALRECDLLIACGSRFGDRATGRVEHFCPQARIIHMDIDESEISKIKPADVRLLGHLQDTLKALRPWIEAQDRPAWHARLRELKSRHLSWSQAQAKTLAGLIRQAGKILGERAIVTTDVGQHQMWTAQNYPHHRPRHWLTSGGLGTMGFGLPAAIGASLACPDQPVVCFSGDGSLIMNIQELATAAEEKVDVKVILFDNQALGLVRQQQDLFFGQRYFASRFQHAVDFVRVAQGFGVEAFSLGHLENPDEMLARGLGTPGPVLIHVPVDDAARVFPMVPPGAANHEMIGGGLHA